MSKVEFLDTAYRTVSKAVEFGVHTRTGKTSHVVDFAGRCQRPIVFETTHRVEIDHGPRKADEAVHPAMFLTRSVPCRRCDKCLRRRAALWKNRAEIEFSHAARVWFATLTLAPQEQFNLLLLTDARLDRRSVVFDKLEVDDQFAERCRTLGIEVTKFLKRLRHYSKGGLRHVVVYERHASGDPHVHLLVYETTVANRITKRQFQSAWHLGFSNVSLCRGRGAIGYTTKYLMKHYAARIRASQNFGVADRQATSPIKPPLALVVEDYAEKNTTPQLQPRGSSDASPRVLGSNNNDGVRANG